MTHTAWAFDPLETIPAHLETSSAQTIDDQIKLQHGSSPGPAAWPTMQIEQMNMQYNTRPMTVEGTLPDEWHVQEPEAAWTRQYVGDKPSQSYLVTRTYREMTYQEARRHARDLIENWVIAYRTSQFDWNGNTYSARTEAAITHIGDMQETLLDNANGLPNHEIYYPEEVFDINADAHVISGLGQWFDFYKNGYRGLVRTAWSTGRQAWSDVKAAGTTAEVKGIVETLPPIPGA